MKRLLGHESSFEIFAKSLIYVAENCDYGETNSMKMTILRKILEFNLPGFCVTISSESANKKKVSR
jgi:hypothetical protein